MDKMDNSTIVKEITNLDTKAPISVTISFEEDETPITTKVVADEYQRETQEIDNSAFVPFKDPRKEIQDEVFTSDLLNEALNNLTCKNSKGQPENLDHSVSNTETSNKRKSADLQNESTSKRRRQNQLDPGNDNCDSKLLLPTREIIDCVVTNLLNPGVPNPENAASQSNQSETLSGLEPNEIVKINTYITRCLASVSEHMRNIINAYDYYKRCQTSAESFKELKMKRFNSCYNILITLVLPEERNLEFIHTFLNDTYQRARKLAGPYYNRTREDYTNLLSEMLMWAKRKQRQIFQATRNSKNVNENTQPANRENSVIDKVVNEQAPKNISNDKSNKNAVADKVCIFSSGPIGSELTINIDPVLSKYFRNAAQESITETKTVQPSRKISDIGSQKSDKNSTTSQCHVTAEHLAKLARYRISKPHPVTQPIAAPVPSVATTTHLQRQPEPSDVTTCVLKNVLNYSISTQQHKAQAPLLQTQLRKQSVPPFCEPSQLMQQQEKSQRQQPPPYSQHLQTLVHYAQQPIFQYDRTRYLPTQIGQQQQFQTPMQYDQTLMSQTQQSSAQYHPSQELQAQLEHTQQAPSQYDASMHLQKPFGHCQPMPEYPQTRHSQTGLSQQYRQERQEQLAITERCPTMTTLLAAESTPAPLHPSYFDSHLGQSKQSSKFINQWENLHKFPSEQRKSRNLAPQQIQPRPTNHTDRHQEVNAVYQVGQVPHETQKGTPRSASTDSGFISPLNFNVSTDHAVPTTSEDPGFSIPVITHVTSLNDRAAFVDVGNCVLCNKSTKQMCMGCMKVYYCTYQCQSLHWSRHEPFCKGSN